ncbi:unnamed protein product [Arabidopsis lyrata]|nr:unnamed protein product [Arabidopsis lyrata]
MEGFLRFLAAKAILLALASSFVSCYDPSPLQDFCVAVDDANGVFVNGKFCKDPKYVKAEDFFTSGLNIAGNTINRVGSNVTNANVDKIPGLNTLGVSLVRIDFAPGGQNPPHTHPRATEILVVVEGTLLVGFVTSNQDNNRLFSKVLYPGDVFVFPIGMIHFQVNVGRTNAVAFAGLGSQNPGTITIADAVFGSKPLITPEILAKAFQLDVNVRTRYEHGLLGGEGLAERWEEWQNLEVTRQEEFQRLQRRFDSINNEDAIELSGGR